MSVEIDEFCERLRLRLDRIDDGVKAVRKKVLARSSAMEADLLANLAELELHVDARMAEMEAARQRVATWNKAKLSSIAEKVDEWKQRRDRVNLQRRAAEAEEIATQSFDIAIFAIEQAEQAALEAHLARADADAADQAPA